jgi:hypothetical protein
MRFDVSAARVKELARVDMCACAGWTSNRSRKEKVNLVNCLLRMWSEQTSKSKKSKFTKPDVGVEPTTLRCRVIELLDREY